MGRIVSLRVVPKSFCITGIPVPAAGHDVSTFFSVGRDEAEVSMALVGVEGAHASNVAGSTLEIQALDQGNHQLAKSEMWPYTAWADFHGKIGKGFNERLMTVCSVEHKAREFGSSQG